MGSSPDGLTREYGHYLAAHGRKYLMNKEQQELSEGVEMFDPQKVERHLLGCCDYEAMWTPMLTEADGWGTAEKAYGCSYVTTADYDQLLSLFTAKDALIASLNAEISKQNKAEDELLATGQKLAEERK
jgi:hypothetical protein